MKARDDFKSRVTVNQETGCWVWPGQCDGFSYPQFSRMGAHRYSWLLHWGAIPEGLFVCHDCDNKSCVNPMHLFLGTQSDNQKDRVLKKAHWVQVRGLWDFLRNPENMKKYERNDSVINALVSGSIALRSRHIFEHMGVVFERVLLPRVQRRA